MVELLAHLVDDGRELAWPVAVVAEVPDDRSLVFRTYCSQWPVDGRRHVRPPILIPGDARPGDVVGRYQAALEAGDAEAIVNTFASDGHLREPIAGPRHTRRGTRELRSFFARCFRAGGGIGLQHCAVTDDGVRWAVEYNCVRWGSHDLQPQAGIGVYERGPGRTAGGGPRLRRRGGTRRDALRRSDVMIAARRRPCRAVAAGAGVEHPGRGFLGRQDPPAAAGGPRGLPRVTGRDRFVESMRPRP